MKIVLTTILLFLGATGCVTASERYSEYLDSLVGKKKRTIIKRFGVPDKVMKLENEEIFVYVDRKGAISYGFGVDLIQCITEFTLEDGVVSDWNWDGHCP